MRDSCSDGARNGTDAVAWLFRVHGPVWEPVLDRALAGLRAL